MSTAQPLQAPEKNDEDRLLQMEEDLLALDWQISNIEDQLCCIMTRIQTAKLDTLETVLTDSVGPSSWRHTPESMTPA
jgi:hypothetical protein